MLSTFSRLTTAASMVLALAMASGAVALPIASDSFESYGLGALTGNNGGTGWGNAWSANSRVNVVSGGLAYSNGSVLVDGGNQSVEVVYNPAEGNGITDGLMSRALSASQAGTVYMSLLFRDTVNPDLGASNDFVQWGFDDGTANPQASMMRRNDTLQARSTTSSGNSADSGISANLGETFLLVLKVEKGGPNYDAVSLFVNPTSTFEPILADAVSSVNSGLSTLDNFVSRSAFHELGDTFLLDAIQIGTSFDDVVQAAPVPEPATAVLGLVGLAGLVTRRRRQA